MPEDLKILEIRMLNSGRPLKAFVDVEVNGWTVRDFRIVGRNGHRLSVLPPQASWKDPETGQIRFKGILTIPPEHKQMIDTMILHAYQVEMEKRYDRNK